MFTTSAVESQRNGSHIPSTQTGGRSKSLHFLFSLFGSVLLGEPKVVYFVLCLKEPALGFIDFFSIVISSLSYVIPL